MPVTSISEFTVLRDQAVAIGALVGLISVEDLEQWVMRAERALGAGPALDQTLYRDAGTELEQQLTFMRALLVFRRAISAAGGPS